jgi:hypothetical protein
MSPGRPPTITETFDHRLAVDPGRQALVGPTGSLTYEELDAADLIDPRDTRPRLIRALEMALPALAQAPGDPVPPRGPTLTQKPWMQWKRPPVMA